MKRQSVAGRQVLDDASSLNEPGPQNDPRQREGGRFRNPAWLTGDDPPASPARLSLLSLLRWRLRRGRTPWPARIIDPPPPGDPRAEPGPGEIDVTFIGHSSFLVRLPGLTLLTDPIFSERASPVRWAGPKRVRAPGRKLRDLPPVDLVLLSHCHYDHLDLPSLRALHRHSAPRVITPLGNARHVRKAAAFEVLELDWWQEAVLDGPAVARITAIPARHFSARTLRDAGCALWAGFMIEAGGFRLLFAGDSGDGRHWQRIRERLGPPDLALLPIGAYEPRALMRRVHMDPAEAVRAHRTLGAARSIGMHFGTFQLTDEGVDAPEEELARERGRQKLAEDRFVTLRFGETRRFVASSER